MKKHILVAVESDTPGTADHKNAFRMKNRMKFQTQTQMKHPIPTETHFFIFFLI